MTTTEGYTRHGATINDRRTDPTVKPWGFVVATDSFMSGWGGAANGRSLYAIAVMSPDEETTVTNNMRDRSEMKRPRTVGAERVGDAWLPTTRYRAGDHVSIADRSEASRFFECGAFRD